jgi:hypothetical protein
MSLLERVPIDELVADIEDAGLATYAGKETRFVGTSLTVAAMTATVSQRIAETGQVYPAPQTWKLFLVALRCMDGAGDGSVVRIYDELACSEPTLKSRR